MRRRRGGLHPLAIAMIMIAIPLFITYYAFHKRLPFTSRYTDYVVVPNSVNVRGGDPVRISGIDVGTVTGTSADGRATKIAFTISQNGRPLHTDATVAIRSRLFLEGSYYLDLFPGSPSAPVASEGFTIPQRNTQTPVQFFQLLSTFDVAARDSLKQLLNESNIAFGAPSGQTPNETNSGAGGFKAAIPQLTPLLKDVAIDSRALAGTRPGDLETLLASSAGVFGTLARNSGRLVDLITSLDRVSGALAASDGALAQSVSGLDQTLRVSPAALTAIDRSLPPLTRLAAALTPSLRVAPPLLSGIESGVRGVIRVTNPSSRPLLLSSLRTTLVDFPVVLTDIGSLFRYTKPATDCLRTHIVPILEEQVPDGALSTNEPVWKDFVHFLPSLASASGQFDGNGPYIRTLVGAGNNSLQSGLSSVPGLGQLVGTSPGGNQIQGARPQWVGTLTPAAFRPDVPCSKEPLPGLTGTRAAADLRTVRDPAAALHPNATLLRRALSLATGHKIARLP
jgi:phospholipid/cholesterol/gamma-HCH transport system substrate-binding protein